MLVLYFGIHSPLLQCNDEDGKHTLTEEEQEEDDCLLPRNCGLVGWPRANDTKHSTTICTFGKLLWKLCWSLEHRSYVRDDSRCLHYEKNVVWDPWPQHYYYCIFNSWRPEEYIASNAQQCRITLSTTTLPWRKIIEWSPAITIVKNVLCVFSTCLRSCMINNIKDE